MGAGAASIYSMLSALSFKSRQRALLVFVSIAACHGFVLLATLYNIHNLRRLLLSRNLSQHALEQAPTATKTSGYTWDPRPIGVDSAIDLSAVLPYTAPPKVDTTARLLERSFRTNCSPGRLSQRSCTYQSSSSSIEARPYLSKLQSNTHHLKALSIPFSLAERTLLWLQSCLRLLSKFRPTKMNLALVGQSLHLVVTIYIGPKLQSHSNPWIAKGSKLILRAAMVVLAMVLPFRKSSKDGLHFDFEQLPILCIHFLSEHTLLQHLAAFQQGAETRLMRIQEVTESQKRLLRQDSLKGSQKIEQLFREMRDILMVQGTLQWTSSLRMGSEKRRSGGDFKVKCRRTSRPMRNDCANMQEPTKQPVGVDTSRGRWHEQPDGANISQPTIRSLSAMRRDSGICASVPSSTEDSERRGPDTSVKRKRALAMSDTVPSSWPHMPGDLGE